MKKFNVSIREILVKSIEVEANSIEEAKEFTKQKYDNEEIFLDYSDFCGDVDVKVYDEEFNQLEDWDDNYIA